MKFEKKKLEKGWVIGRYVGIWFLYFIKDYIFINSCI